MAEGDDRASEETRDRPTGPDRAPGEDRGYTEEEQGESRTTNPAAPASSGRTHGDEGTVQPEGGPDLRPAGSGTGPPAERGEETPVPSPSGGASKGQGVKTGSAAAAAATAGPESDAEASEASDVEGEDEDDDER